MKKTLILIASLAVAVAQADVLTLTPASGSLQQSVTSGFTATPYTNTFYTVGTNVGNGGSWTWTSDTFTLAEDVTLDSVNAVLLTFNGDGKRQYASRDGYYTFTIQDAQGTAVYTSGQTGVTFEGALSSGTTASTATSSSVGDASGAYVTSAPGVALAAGDYTLSLKVEDNDPEGYFVGINSIGVSYSANVPEPATATLSLLALAGLAARRRRK